MGAKVVTRPARSAQEHGMSELYFFVHPASFTQFKDPALHPAIWEAVKLRGKEVKTERGSNPELHHALEPKRQKIMLYTLSQPHLACLRFKSGLLFLYCRF